MYRYLSLDIADDSKDSSGQKRTVETCLDHFFQPEDRELNCEKCEDGTEATQTMRILSRPKAVLVHLKRFVLVEKPGVENSENQSPRIAMTFRKDKVSLQKDTFQSVGGSVF